MRLAHITATFPPQWTGTGLVCYHNARQLARLGHEVHVFTARLPGAPAEETLDGVHVHRLRPLLQIGNAPLLPDLLRLRGFDLLHLHYPFYGGEFTALAARRTRTPLVITYHQDVLLAGAMGVIEKLLRHTSGRFALRSASKVLFTTLDYSRHSYARKLLAGREEAIGEMPNGVDVQFFTPAPAPAALIQRFKPTGNEKIALLVAGLDRAHYFKGVPVFLQSLSQLPAHVHGVIVGEGDLRSAYLQQAHQMGLASRLHFPGRVPIQDLPGYYRLAEVTLLPSVTMGEAFGLVLIESLACATPVIASDLPGVRTVVAHGQDGLLVPPADPALLAAALHQLLDLPPDARRSMGLAGRRKVVEKYAWEKIGLRLETLYRQVLSPSAA